MNVEQGDQHGAGVTTNSVGEELQWVLGTDNLPHFPVYWYHIFMLWSSSLVLLCLKKQELKEIRVLLSHTRVELLPRFPVVNGRWKFWWPPPGKASTCQATRLSS